MSSSVTSPTAFNAYTNLTLSALSLNGVMRRLSTGVKGVVDDGAGVAISERMRSQANSTAKAANNVDNGISMLQTADTWMQQISDLLGRMHELAVDASDATKTGDDLANINTEFAQLQSEVRRVTDQAAKFNGAMLFSSDFTNVATQVGADSGQTITFMLKDLTSDTTVTVSTGLDWASIVDAADMKVSVASAAQDAISRLQSAINFIGNERAAVGAQQERLEKTRTGLLSYEDQIVSAESKIRTIDTARESSEMMKYQILTQIGTAMLSQANQLPAASVQLVGGR